MAGSEDRGRPGCAPPRLVVTEADRAPARPRILMIGGDGAPSGVPCHLSHLTEALAPVARVTLVSDRDRGGYGFARRPGGPGHVEVQGLGRLRRCLGAARGLARLVSRTRPDLVWAHARGGILALRLGLALGMVPHRGMQLAVTYHGLPFDAGHRPLARWLSRVAERALLRRGPAQTLIFLSAAQRDLFIGQVGGRALRRHTLVVLGNRSGLGPLPQGEGHPARRHLVMTGRAGWQKNPARALRLFASLPPGYTMTLCGTGTATPRFRAQARRILGPLAIQRLTLAGPVPDPRPILATADCYLLTSRYEGEPIGALEAFEAGLPMALPAIEGTRTLRAAHPHCVTLSDPESPAEDAQRIVALTEGYLRRRGELSAQIKQAWADKYAPGPWAEEARKVLRQILWRADGGDSCAEGAAPSLRDLG